MVILNHVRNTAIPYYHGCIVRMPLNSMANSAAAPKRQTRYRFRVRAQDGTEVVSDVFSVDDPNGELPGLTEPSWISSLAELAHGDRVGMRVKGTAKEGSTVRFALEHGSGANWTASGSATAQLKNGVAEAWIDVRHPSLPAGTPASHEDHADLGSAELRFTAELVAA